MLDPGKLLPATMQDIARFCATDEAKREQLRPGIAQQVAVDLVCYYRDLIHVAICVDDGPPHLLTQCQAEKLLEDLIYYTRTLRGEPVAHETDEDDDGEEQAA